MRSVRRRALLVLVCAVASQGALRAADWAGFRGPSGNAVSEATNLPETWSDSEHLAWKVELPGMGSSSPIIVGNRVFVTCYGGYGVDRNKPGKQEDLSRHLVCVDLKTGKIQWDKSVKATLPEDDYTGFIAEHGYSSSTPTSDGKNVYVFFGKSGVLAFDLEGNQLWQTSVGTGSDFMHWGSGTSPVVHGDLVFVNASAESQALVALSTKDGHKVWTSPAEGFANSWSTPSLVDVPGGKTELVVNVPYELWGFDPESGDLLWTCTGIEEQTINASMVSRNGIVYALGGRRGTCLAVRAGGRDDVTKTHVVWKQDAGSSTPSPVLYGDHLYWVNDQGTAFCLDADSGEVVFKERISGARGLYASVVAAENKLYAVTRRDGTFVLDAGPEYKKLAHNQFASDTSDFNASPAISDGRILIRSNRFLYCLGADK